ncbi:hypothetical protein E6O75_ATG02176 [Venturia nashicola]|uniref:Uncharacterized protein n=1 Tax=Venturia nashicola TaxID=86259 RepID=A0A4Z1PKV2_9PEZI|nr:hypothetical protein E6O75_ATG02176 [Venturia nashicola]
MQQGSSNIGPLYFLPALDSNSSERSVLGVDGSVESIVVEDLIESSLFMDFVFTGICSSLSAASSASEKCFSCSSTFSLGISARNEDIGFRLDAGRSVSRRPASFPLICSALYFLLPTYMTWSLEYFCNIEEAVARDIIGPLILRTPKIDVSTDDVGRVGMTEFDQECILIDAADEGLIRDLILPRWLIPRSSLRDVV